MLIALDSYASCYNCKRVHEALIKVLNVSTDILTIGIIQDSTNADGDITIYQLLKMLWIVTRRLKSHLM